MGDGPNKQRRLLAGKPVLAHTLELFQTCSLINEIVVVAAEDQVAAIEKEIVAAYNITKVSKVVVGGQERQDSVWLGLQGVDPETEWVVVHDGARPLLLSEQLAKIVKKSRELGGAIAAMPVKDTVKQVNMAGEVTATPLRKEIWGAQTPQTFRKEVLVRAYELARETGRVGTDDASLIEALGEKVNVVEGSYENIKITTSEDMDIALAILRRREEERARVRVGFGYDVHRLVEGRDLILGGEKVEYSLGLEGHSDADVLVHAIMDALLGATSLGDIGKHFPDTDEKYRGISSLELLAHVAELIKQTGYSISNLDATIVAQRPKLAPYMGRMVEKIAGVLQVDHGRVNVKATTTEGLGFTGRGEGISAYAVALLEDFRV